MKLFTPSWYKKCIITTSIALLGLGSSYGSMQNLYCDPGYQETINSVAGRLDHSFEPGLGANGIVTSVVELADGRILVAGNFTSYDGTSRNRIARLKPDGALDSSFNPGIGANNIITSIAVQNDGFILIGGNFTSYDGSSRNRIARLKPDGALDSSFNPGIGANGIINDIAIQTDGNIMIGGDFTSYDGTSINRIARLKFSGGLESSFNPGAGTNAAIRSIAIQTDGFILIGGDFLSYDNITQRYISRLKPTGVLDSSFVGSTDNIINDIKIQNDGKILIGGNFTSYNGVNRNFLARLNTNGNIDNTFNNNQGPDGRIFDIKIQADGKIVIGGAFTSYDGNPRNNIARINTDSSIDSSFEPSDDGVSSTVLTIEELTNNQILIGGYFTSVDATSRNRIARLTKEDITCNGTGTCGSAHLSFTGAFPTSGLCSIGTPFLQQVSTLNLGSGNTITTYSWSCTNIGGGTPASCIAYQTPATGTTCVPYTGNINNYNYTTSFSGNQVAVLLNASGTNADLGLDPNYILAIPNSNTTSLTGIVSANAYLSIQLKNLKNISQTGTPQESQFVQYRATTQDGSGNTVGGAFYGCDATERPINNPLSWQGANISAGGAFYISPTRGSVTSSDIVSQFLAWAKQDEGFEMNCQVCMGSNIITTQTGTCTGLPANAVPNTATSILQFNSNGTWLPSTQYSYSATGSLATCSFTCAANYTRNGSACVGITNSATCTGLPANAIPNTATSISQTWNGSIWTPNTGYTFNTTPSTTSCNFVCAANYTRNGSACIANTQTGACANLPANAIPNTATSISQTWNGFTWLPSTGYDFNLTPSTTSCNFVCASGYTWDGNACVAFNPVSTVACGSLSSVVQGTPITTSTPDTCSGSSIIGSSIQSVGFGINGCTSAQGCVQWQCGNGNPSENVACIIPYTLNACGGATTFTDPRDGITYNIVEAGGKCWFKEPLRFEDTEVRNMTTENQAFAAYPPNVDGTYCGPNTTANNYKGDQELNIGEEGPGCVNLNVRDSDGYGYVGLSTSPSHMRLRDLITYTNFTTRNTTPPSRTQSSLPSLLKSAIQHRASYLGRFIPGTYTASWGVHPTIGTILSVLINYGPNYPYVSSANYISDSSYTTLRNAGSNGLTGTSIPTDIKAMCTRFWPGVSQSQITKVGYFDAYRMNCSKTGGIAPHNQTVEIAAATIQNKSFAYDTYEFYTNLGEFCPTGWRAPFESDYTSLTWTGRQALDLKTRISREGQYLGLGGIYKELKGPIEPLFVANGSWLGYSESNDSGSYNTYTLNPIWSIQSTTPNNPNMPTTKEMRCIKETAPVGWNTSGWSSCAATYCPAPYTYVASWGGNNIPSCRSAQGVEGPAPTGQSTRTVTCRQGSTIIPDYFCTKIAKPSTQQACAIANPGGMGLSG